MWHKVATGYAVATLCHMRDSGLWRYFAAQIQGALYRDEERICLCRDHYCFMVCISEDGGQNIDLGLANVVESGTE